MSDGTESSGWEKRFLVRFRFMIAVIGSSSEQNDKENLSEENALSQKPNHEGRGMLMGLSVDDNDPLPAHHSVVRPILPAQ